MNKPVIVISAVNLVEAGPFSILKEAVESFVKLFINDYRLIVLINDKSLLDQFSDKIEMHQYSYPKRSWLLRVWFEYVHSFFISKKINPLIWIALHDMTPNTACKHQVVYCHNPAPFYRFNFREILQEKKLLFFSSFYSLFYKINIKKNDFIIVQQQWLRDEFIRRYNVKSVMVAHPEVHAPSKLPEVSASEKYKFFFPSYPRPFKNFEVLLRAAENLNKIRNDFEVLVTINGDENKYAEWLSKNFKHLKCIRFLGFQQREKIWSLYNETNCLVFASKLETWGLPITEMKFFNKPVLVADKEYAYETVGIYDKCCFFEPDNCKELSSLMNLAIDNALRFDKPRMIEPKRPFTKNWEELFSVLFEKVT